MIYGLSTDDFIIEHFSKIYPSGVKISWHLDELFVNGCLNVGQERVVCIIYKSWSYFRCRSHFVLEKLQVRVELSRPGCYSHPHKLEWLPAGVVPPSLEPWLMRKACRSLAEPCVNMAMRGFVPSAPTTIRESPSGACCMPVPGAGHRPGTVRFFQRLT